MLRALSLDYWDTLVVGALVPSRSAFRQAALRRLMETFGRPLSDEEFRDVYRASGREAERWWAEEQRGYHSSDRIRWMLKQVGVERPTDCEHVARACQAVDDSLLQPPPEPMAGAAEVLPALARRFTLAIISDSGFASGRAQDRVLAHWGLLDYFPVRIYSMDIGWAKPRPEPFAAAAAALGVRPDEMLHVGDLERTDVRGALAAGMRAVRFDAVRDGEPTTAAERVVRSFAELAEYLGARD